MVDHGQGLLWRADLAARQTQSLERLRARHLVNEMTIDVEETSAIRLLVDDVIIPDLVVQRARASRVGCDHLRLSCIAAGARIGT